MPSSYEYFEPQFPKYLFIFASSFSLYFSFFFVSRFLKSQTWSLIFVRSKIIFTLFPNSKKKTLLELHLTKFSAKSKNLLGSVSHYHSLRSFCAARSYFRRGASCLGAHGFPLSPSPLSLPRCPTLTHSLSLSLSLSPSLSL